MSPWLPEKQISKLPRVYTIRMIFHVPLDSVSSSEKKKMNRLSFLKTEPTGMALTEMSPMQIHPPSLRSKHIVCFVKDSPLSLRV